MNDLNELNDLNDPGDLNDLLLRWHDGSLSADEVTALKQALGDPSTRAAALRHWHDSAVILASLREQAAAASEQPGSATARMRVVSRSIRAAAAPGAHQHTARKPAGRGQGARRRWLAGAVLAVAVALAAVLGLRFEQRATASGSVARALAHITALGAATSAGPGGYLIASGTTRQVPVAVGMALGSGDRITTQDAGLRLQLGEEATTLALAADTILEISDAPGRRTMTLSYGGIDAVVAHQPAGRVLLFITPQAAAQVIGTRFTLVVAHDATRLAVSEGRVRFQALDTGAALEIGARDAAVASRQGLARDAGLAVRGPLVPAQGCLWGASLRSEPAARALASGLEAAIGRRLAVVHQYQTFADFAGQKPFPSALQRSWAAGGRLLCIAWKPRLGERLLRWSEVAQGRADADYIDVLARKAAAWNQPFFLCLHHDPEEVIGPAGSGMTAADYVAMWRHVHARFLRAGATRVVWVWTMSGAANAVARWDACYPGDDCVDWLGCSAYNTARDAAGGLRWRSFSELVAPFLDWSRNRFPGAQAKPIMIAVYACAEDPGPGPTKQDWFRALPEALQGCPEIKALIYFHDRTLRADSSAAALAGFSAAGADPRLQTPSPPASP